MFEHYYWPRLETSETDLQAKYFFYILLCIYWPMYQSINAGINHRSPGIWASADDICIFSPTLSVSKKA